MLGRSQGEEERKEEREGKGEEGGEDGVLYCIEDLPCLVLPYLAYLEKDTYTYSALLYQRVSTT